MGFVLKRPKKRLVKAHQRNRESFVAEYAGLVSKARQTGAKIFFAGEAHFRADAELRGKWVLKGDPVLVHSTSPRRGEKASYYSAVCLETGEVEWMELEGNSNAGTSAAFLRQLRKRYLGPLNVVWDNAPAHRGEAMQEYLRTPGLDLRLVNLPDYSPDFNADEAIRGWVREEATGNLCLGIKAVVQQRVSDFLDRLASRKQERGGETPLPDRPAIKGGRSPAELTFPFPIPRKCTSHLGFGLVGIVRNGCKAKRAKRGVRLSLRTMIYLRKSGLSTFSGRESLSAPTTNPRVSPKTASTRRPNTSFDSVPDPIPPTWKTYIMPIKKNMMPIPTSDLALLFR